MSRIKLPSLFTRAYFVARATAIKVFVGGVPMTIKPKAFKTGSLGWHSSTKQQIAVGDTVVWCQVSQQITIIGSKELPLDGPEVPHAETAA